VGRPHKGYLANLFKTSAGRMYFFPEGQHESSQARSAWSRTTTSAFLRDRALCIDIQATSCLSLFSVLRPEAPSGRNVYFALPRVNPG
jgi:hypothetical protein